MPSNHSAPIFSNNKCTKEASCEHCGGVVRHERWCITLNQVVHYAFTAVFDAERLSFGDRMILHALGVSWVQNGFAGKREPAR